MTAVERARALPAGLDGDAKSAVTKEESRTFADQSVAACGCRPDRLGLSQRTEGDRGAHCNSANLRRSHRQPRPSRSSLRAPVGHTEVGLRRMLRRGGHIDRSSWEAPSAQGPILYLCHPRPVNGDVPG